MHKHTASESPKQVQKVFSFVLISMSCVNQGDMCQRLKLELTVGL